MVGRAGDESDAHRAARLTCEMFPMTRGIDPIQVLNESTQIIVVALHLVSRNASGCILAITH